MAKKPKPPAPPSDRGPNPAVVALLEAERIAFQPGANAADLARVRDLLNDYPDARAAFNLTHGERTSPAHNPATPPPAPASDTELLDGEPDEEPDDGVTDEAIAAVAVASQDEYDDETVTLYRPIVGPAADALRERAAAGAPIDLRLAALERFTEDEAVARSRGVAVRVEIPRASIAASWRAVPGMRDGEVFVVTAGSLRVNPADVLVLGELAHPPPRN